MSVKDCCYYSMPDSVLGTKGVTKAMKEMVPTIQELITLCWKTKIHPNETDM